MDRFLFNLKKVSQNSLNICLQRCIFYCALLGFLFISQPSFAQQQHVKLSQKTLIVSQFFHEIEKQTGYLFVYKDNEINIKENISFPQTVGSLVYFLDQFVQGKKIRYEFTNQKYIVLSPQKISQAQIKKVTGTVRDGSGEPLVGATIQQKGTSNKTISDTEGHFTLEAPMGATLIVSFIGLQDLEVKATSTMSITLNDDTNAIDEVVVVGYGTVKKADLAGSVSVLDNKAFKDQPLTRVDDALQGRIAGVHVVSSGIPGGDMKIRIRGAGSINRSNDPLYVVDGIVRESGLTGLDPEDIQSIQVLKDASATAIYGSRGSNGVVLVTTKAGKADYKQIKVPYSDILYIEGLKDYVKIYLTTQPQPLVTLLSLKKLEEQLPAERFMRVHRSFIVALDKVQVVERSQIVFGNQRITIADANKEAFLQRVRINSEN